MYFGIVTLFPEMFSAITEYGVSGRACRRGLITAAFFNPRDYAQDEARSVDDRPYGGGPGMLMKVQPLRDAIAAARRAAPPGTRVVCMTPQGRPLNHALVCDICGWGAAIVVAGRYAGIDERVMQADIDLEISLGDYVLSGGELPAMCIMDAVARQVPGVLGDPENARDEAFAQGLLHYPQYTRPDAVDGCGVPEVLLSGDHARIRQWRLQQSLIRTYERRPDLLRERRLSQAEYLLLREYLQARSACNADEILDSYFAR